MHIIIKETGELEELAIQCQRSGVDYIQDFIGNAGGFSNNNFIKFDELSDAEKETYKEQDDEYYYASQEDFAWWKHVVDTTATADALIAEHKGKLSAEVESELFNAYDNDIESTAERRLQIIRAAIGKKND